LPLISEAEGLLPEPCWDAVRALRAAVKGATEPFRFASLRIGPEPAAALERRLEPAGGSAGVTVLAEETPNVLVPSSETVLRVRELVDFELVQRGNAPESVLDFLRIYLPYAVAPAEAKKKGRAIAVCHFAQTLDGRIATGSGDSRWIGCSENLVHAHRMRALCDAVMVGSGTLRRDRPRLNVRHVEGDDPLRVVIGSAPLDLSSLLEASDAPVVTIGDVAENGAELLPVQRREGRMHGSDILEALYARGVHTVLVEGGCATTSALLEEGAIDIVQLHIEPLLLGPGVSSFDRPPARQIADAMTFRRHAFFPVGRGMMFVGAR
jgi:diaminohydroxyphosphoribosylaminopyrimidine deaminase/5-amino-6-(5-phosphoribosylamino)uracil reductase